MYLMRNHDIWIYVRCANSDPRIAFDRLYDLIDEAAGHGFLVRGTSFDHCSGNTLKDRIGLRTMLDAVENGRIEAVMHTDRYKLADGSIREKVQPKYNCFQRGQRNKGGRDCDGQALYLAERVDAIVLKIVEEVFEQIRDTPYSQVAENRIRQESNLQKTKRAAAEKKIKAAQHALERFEGEILKCLDGTSNFTEDMIAKQIRRYQQELDDAKAEYAELQNARLNEAAEIRKQWNVTLIPYEELVAEWCGKVVGVCNYAASESDLDGIEYGWRLSDVRKLKSRIQCKGALKLWTMNAALSKMVVAQL